MANFSALKTAIQNAIKTNGNNEITGQLLQDILLAMVSTMGDSAINDLAVALTNEASTRSSADGQLQTAINAIHSMIDNGYVYAGIATPSSTPASGHVFYIAVQPGTYTNFSNIVVFEGLTILKKNGESWAKEQIMYKDGGVFDISAYKNATYADLTAALNGGTNIPQSIQKGGMSIKFVQSSDNKYVQYRLMLSTFTAAQFTNTANWQGVDDEPTAGSDNLVKSGGVFVKTTLSPIIDKTEVEIPLSFSDDYFYKSDSIVPQSNSGSKYTPNKIDISGFDGRILTILAPTYSSSGSDTRACLVLDENENILDAQTWIGAETSVNKKLVFDLAQIHNAKYILLSYRAVNCPEGIKLLVKISDESVKGLTERVQVIESNISGIVIDTSFSDDYYYKRDSIVPQSNVGSKYTPNKIDISEYNGKVLTVLAPIYSSVGSDTRACMILDSNNNILQAKTWIGGETTENKKLEFDLKAIQGAKYMLLSYRSANCPEGIKLICDYSDKSVGELNANVKYLESHLDNIALFGTTKYAHISFDDMQAPFAWLAQNYETVTSIFEENFFAFLKTIHETYGAVFTLNCFVEDLVDLAEKGDKFALEFSSCSNWLKFAFHAYAGGISYDPETEHEYRASIAADYDMFVNAVLGITGNAKSIHQVSRLGYYEGSLENLLIVKGRYMGLYGFLCADDSRNSYYLNGLLSNLVFTQGHWYDAQANLYFISTKPSRFDVASDVTEDSAKAMAYNSISQLKIGFAEILIHQATFYQDVASDTLYSSRGNIILAAVCEELKAEGYQFSFTQRHLRNW